MNQNDIEAMIQRYTEAEMAVLDGKSVTFNGQQMTMENLSEIRQGRQEWERRLAALITRRRGHPGYLNGVDTPYIDQMEGFSVDGVTTKVRIDAGVAPVDHRGLVKCTA